MSTQSVRLPGILFALALAFAAPSARAVPQASETYSVIDSLEGSHVSLAAFPIRPMLVIEGAEDSLDEIWAVNQPDSTVEVFVGETETPANVYPVPWNPVSLAFWAGPTSAANDDEIFVVCRGSWAIARLSRTSGAVKQVIQMRDDLPALDDGTPARMGRMAEPGDIVIDADPGRLRGFVSCTASDSVIQFDLVTGEITSVFDLLHPGAKPLWKQPLFLSLESDGDVLVTPLTSGNNTTWGGGLNFGQRVENVEPDCQNEDGLPDQDLFRITPFVSSASPGGTAVVANELGTILFANALQNANLLWQLNTDARNAESVQGEPSARGIFSRNRITIFNLATSSIVQTVSLDPPAMGGPQEIDVTNTVGQPFCITFDADTDGNAVIAGMLTDNVMVINATAPYGIRKEWDVSAGAIPRGIQMRGWGSGKRVLVYCWGLHRIEEYSYTQTPTLLKSYAFRHDPTPAAVKAGRQLFFDGTNSLHQNLSCASCHVDGGSDLLVWNLSNRLPSGGTSTLPLDDKGGMVTQTLVGIERVSPFHWRGERRLSDFNDFAFEGLLGGTQPSDSEAANFQAFLFSLRNPANPYQHRDRVLDDAITLDDGFDPVHASSARDGQVTFLQTPSFQGPAFTCANCHSMPTGTLSDINPEQDGQRPSRANIKPAAFTELYRKMMPYDRVIFYDDQCSGSLQTTTRGFLGIGYFHEGTENPGMDPAVVPNTLAQTIRRVVASSTLDTEDIGAFVLQWDQGLAPAVHCAALLNNTAMSDTASQLDYLYAQAKVQTGHGRPNCDIVVFGQVAVDPNVVPVVLLERRWFYHRRTDRFRCEDPSFAHRTLATFKSATNLAAGESNVFFGVPVGSGERIGVDFDSDEFFNLNASVGEDQGTNRYNPLVPNQIDTTPPIVASGEPKLLWKTARVARIVFSTDDLSTGFVDYRPLGAADWQSVPTGDYSRRHSIVLTDLLPSTTRGNGYVPNQTVTYEVRVRVHNRALPTQTTTVNLASSPLNPTAGQFDTEPHILPSINFSPSTNGKQRRRLKAHVIDVATPTPSSVSPGYTGSFTIDFTIAHRRGARFVSGSLDRDKAPDRMVIGHVLHIRPGSPATLVTPTGTTYPLSSAFYLNCHPTECAPCQCVKLGVDGVTGTVLVRSDFTSLAGTTSIGFQLPGSISLQAGDAVHFVVDAVVEVDPDHPTPLRVIDSDQSLVIETQYLYPPGVSEDNSGFTQWSMPDVVDAAAISSEDRAFVTIKVQ